jgi:uncharacterized protein
MTTTTIFTYSGVSFDLLDPKPENVRLADLTVPMSGILRFNAHTAQGINLLQHSKLVFDLVGWKAKPYALLHDAHEAYIGDIATPVAHAISPEGWGSVTALDALKSTLDVTIWRAFGLGFPTGEIVDEIQEADRMALSIERQAFAFSGPEELWIGLPDPLPLDIPECNRGQFAHLLTRWCPKVPA